MFKTELDASVLLRLTHYFSDKYQASPENGYTEFIANILKHENIDIKCNIDYFDKNFSLTADIIIYTGPIDKYFEEDVEKNKNVHFLGRLANYKYFNMDQAIKNSLDYYNDNFSKKEVKRKNYLVIIPVGNNSYHIKNNWHLKNDRNFDLCLNYFEDDSNKALLYEKDADYFFRLKGTKWQICISLLETNDFWKNYKYIWFPDDDLVFHLNDVNDMFTLVDSKSYLLAQPSLYNVNVSHIFLTNRGNKSTKIHFIEIQMPCFEINIFKKYIYNFLIDNKWNKSGWGFDLWWSNMKQVPVEKYLLHEFKVLHTKRMDINSGFYKKFNINPFQDNDIIKKKYNL